MNIARSAYPRDHTYPGLPDPERAPTLPANPTVPTTKRWKKRHAAVPLLAAGLGFGLMSGLIAVLRPDSPDPAPVPAVKPSPHNLLVATGAGTRTTRVFSTGTDWTLRYSFQCAKVHGFVVTEYASSGRRYATLVDSAQGTGTEAVPQHHDPGGHYLQVRSGCSWTVTAIG